MFYSNRSEADTNHIHLLVLLSLQLHSLIKSNYYLIYMKHYAWIPMKRKAPNLYMFCVGFVNHSLLVMQSINRSRVHTCCPQMMQNLAHSNTKQSPCLFSNSLRCPEEHRSISHQIGSTSCAAQQSLSSWRRRSYDWLWLCQTNSWGQPGCIFCLSKSSLLSIQFLSISSTVYSTCGPTCSPS